VPFDPFPPLRTDNPIVLQIADFARLPDIAGRAARMMHMVSEPGTARLFVSDMNGHLYAISRDGRSVGEYLDLPDPRWNVELERRGREQGLQNFAFHPQFGQQGTPGYGKFYTYADSHNVAHKADFVPLGPRVSHDTVVLEWTANTPGAARYDGGPPRELLRVRQPFANHNAGGMSFNPTARPGSEDFGLLYIGLADGGGASDPMRMAQNPQQIFGKIIRIDPLGSNSANRRYGIPGSNPWAADNDPDTLGEVYAYGLRNPQQIGWDTRTGDLLVADIGQSLVEGVSRVPPGSNHGWNDWEGSYRFVSRSEIVLENARSDLAVTYPFVEFDHADPLFTGLVAVTGVIAYRHAAVSQLTDQVIFGDIVSGEVFSVGADEARQGGADGIRRIMFEDGGTQKNLLTLMQESAASAGRPIPGRADLRMAAGPSGEIFLMNRGDGTIRVITP
jgi:hypothetical protein